MDERKKTIRDLEEQQKTNAAAIGALLEQLGESLLSRRTEGLKTGGLQTGGLQTGGLQTGGLIDTAAGDAVSFDAELAEYQRLLKDISDSEGYIAATEGDVARLKKLEEDIRGKEQDGAEQTKGLGRLYTRIGELVLEDSEFSAFAQPYQAQLESLIPKIKSLEGRLDDLGGKEDPNVFAWIGKNAQSMVLRSFLGKTQGNLQRIYQAAGEKFALSASGVAVSSAPVLDALRAVDDSRKAQGALSTELALLREERRRINESFSVDGSPVKKIQGLQRHIAHAREELGELHLRYGELAEASPTAAEFAPMLTAEDRLLLERAGTLREAAAENETRIEKLKASLAIDEEREKIAKMTKAIEEHRQRIANSEGAIRDLSDQIAAAEGRIGDLSQTLV
ncbi:hypothetical protein FACS1894124_5970 [Spirochaetia bacterium]|nr:hypothetical protein FACS1894124_5970 [Spirochaetia bacterium]